MAAKRVSPGKKTTRQKAGIEVPEAIAAGAAMPDPEAGQSARAVSSSIDPEIRRQLVEAEAYFLAERRGFAAGHELADWLAAEAAVDARCHQMRNA
jgi:hypothetical protein